MVADQKNPGSLGEQNGHQVFVACLSRPNGWWDRLSRQQVLLAAVLALQPHFVIWLARH
jgi:hypothetical protein